MLSRVATSLQCTPAEAYRHLMEDTHLTLSVLRARNDDALLDLAMRVRGGDEAAAKEAKQLPPETRRVVLELVMMVNEPQ